MGEFFKNNRFAGSWAIMVLDLAISIFASLLAVLFIRWQLHPIFEFTEHVILWITAVIVASIISFFAVGTHKIVIRHSSFRSVGRITIAVILKDAILGLIFLLQIIHLENSRVETFLLIADFGLTLFFLVTARVIIISIFDNIREDNVEENVNKLGVMVYGTGNKSVAMLTRLETSPHYTILGFLSSDKSMGGKVIRDERVWYCDSIEGLAEIKAKLGVECLLFATDEDSTAKNELINMCMDLGIHILGAPKIDEMKFGSMSRNAVKEINNRSVDYIPDGMNSFERNVKRFVDCVIALILLIIFSPLFLVCYIAIKLGDGGPAIYRQERIGRFGRPFNILKFRSMRMDAEAFGPALYSGDDDPRLTKVGKFLRQHHLDELPQLWNVFVGDMAFIGYRPERKFYIDQIMEEDPRYYYLYQIRPGVTSYATLYNGYTDTIEKMVKRLEYDLYYLRHRSWWFDIKILFLTFCNIVFGKKF